MENIPGYLEYQYAREIMCECENLKICKCKVRQSLGFGGLCYLS
jgi:hypothetical protein